jgi:hypothetical protein
VGEVLDGDKPGRPMCHLRAILKFKIEICKILES